MIAFPRSSRQELHDDLAERLAVIGTGLIGASAALAARRAGVADVRGWDPDEAHLATPCERGAVEGAADLAGAVADAEIVLVATPVGDLPHTVREVLDRAPAGCTVTDVGSTKGPVCAAQGRRPVRRRHPICGAETRGPDRLRPTCSRARRGS